MSQIQRFGLSGVPPAGPVFTLTGDLGPAVGPTGNNVNIQGIPTTDIPNPDILFGFGKLVTQTTFENPVMPASTIKIEPLFDRVQTVGAVLLEFPNAAYELSASQSVVFCANVIGNRDDYTAACGGTLTGVIRKPAVGAAVVIGDNPVISSDAVPADAEFGLGLNGDTVHVFVQGVVGQTWNWTCTYTYQVQLL